MVRPQMISHRKIVDLPTKIMSLPSLRVKAFHSITQLSAVLPCPCHVELNHFFQAAITPIAYPDCEHPTHTVGPYSRDGRDLLLSCAIWGSAGTSFIAKQYVQFMFER